MAVSLFYTTEGIQQIMFESKQQKMLTKIRKYIASYMNRNDMRTETISSVKREKYSTR